MTDTPILASLANKLTNTNMEAPATPRDAHPLLINHLLLFVLHVPILVARVLDPAIKSVTPAYRATTYLEHSASSVIVNARHALDQIPTNVILAMSVHF